MPRLKKWNKGEYDQIKVKVSKEINKRYKGYLKFKKITAQAHLENTIINIITK